MIDDARLQLIDNIRIAVAEHSDEESILRTAVELIDAFSDAYNWTGVYMMRGNALEVGPFIGPDTPHKKIELNRGICGAAATSKASIIIGDVTADPRFLACTPTTRSEIVVPLMDGNKVLGEIDIDSNLPSYFNAQDKEMLEGVAMTIVGRLKQIG